MNRRLPALLKRHTRLGIGLAALVFLGSLAISLLLWQRAERSARQELQTYFDFRSRDALARLEARLKVYEQVLKGTHGLMAASGRTTREQFRSYVGNLSLEREFPGIQGVGFALRLAPEELPRHVASIRAEGFPQYTIRPEGPRDPYSSIIFLEPFTGRNLRAFGYDMFSEAVRREAMQRACDTGETALSGKVTLVQETSQDVQAGVLMYLPLYTPGPTPTDPENRRARLRGWVYAPFRMNDFFQGVLGERAVDLDIEVRDGDTPGPGDLLYDKEAQTQISPDPQGLSQQDHISFGGRRWTVNLRALPSMRTRLHQSQPKAILAVGALLGALLGLLAGQLVRERDRALRRVELLQGRYREVMAQSKDAIILMTTEGRVLEVSPQTLLLLGMRSEDLIGHTVKELLQEEVRAHILGALEEARHLGSCHFETTLRRADGRIVPVEAIVTLTLLGGESQLLGIVRDISERKEQQARLESEHQRLLDILKGTNAGTWEWEVPTGKVVFNERWAEMLGYRLADLEPLTIQTWMDLAHPDDLERSSALLQAHFSGKLDYYECEARMKHRDGSWIWVLDRGRVVTWTKDGQPQLMSGTHLEITETKRAQEALLKSEAAYRDLFQGNTTPMFLVDPADGRLVDVNAAGVAFYGHPKDQLLRMCISDINTLPEEEVRLAMDEVKSGQARSFEFTHRLADGGLREVLVSSTRIWFGDREVLHSIIQDISERKHAEAALVESEARYRSYVDSAPEAIFVADELGNYLEVNEAACRITGFSAEELLGMNLRALIPPADRSRALAHFNTLQQAGWAYDELHFQPKKGEARQWSVKAVKLSENRFLAHARDITEEHDLRRALQEREENFRAFFESMDDFLFVGSLDGRILFTNRAVQDKLGFGPDECAAMQLIEFHPETLRAEAAEIFSAMFRGERDHCPLPLRTRTGAQIPVETRVWFGHWSGEPCIYGVSKDLSKQEAAHQKFNRFFEANPAIMAVSDPEGRFIEVNQAFLTTLGYRREELLGYSAQELNLFVEPEKQQELKETLLRDGRFEGRELKIRCKDGSLRTGIFSGETIPFEGRQHLLTVMMDYTERRRLQEDLARISREQQALLENASIGITFVQDRKQVWCNRKMADIFGYSAEEMRLMDTRTFYAHPEDHERVGLQGYPALLQGLPYGLDVEMRRKDGTTFWAHLRGKLLDLGHPEQGSIWSFDDITARLEAERALADLNERLELRVEEELEKNRQQEQLLIAQSRQAAMGEMIGHIAHQWRQPLSALGLVISNIRDAHRFNRLTPEFMERAREDSQRLIQKMSTTINDFMNFFRKDKGLTVFGVGEQVRQAVALVQASLSHHGIGIHIQVTADFQVLGSPGEFSQVLLNLLTNAKEAILAGETGEGEVRIHLETGPAAGLIRIQDNGGGIPTGILDRIFDPYFSTKEMGTGLGLYMSRMIIEHNMGGQLRARNLEVGAELSVTLPLAKENP